MKGNLLWSHEFEGPGITGITFDGEQFIIDAVSKRYFFDRYGNLLRCETKDWERPALTSDDNYYSDINNESLMLFDKQHKLLWSYDLPTDTRYAGKSVRVSPEGAVAVNFLYPSPSRGSGRSVGYSGGPVSTFIRPGESLVAGTLRIAEQRAGGRGGGEPVYWRVLFFNKEGNLLWDSGKKRGGNRVMHIGDFFVCRESYTNDITTLYILDRQNTRCLNITGDEYYKNPYTIVGISPDMDYIIGYADLKGAWTIPLHKYNELPKTKILFFGKLEYVAREKIDIVKSMVSKASSEGFNVFDIRVQDILSQADKAFLTGNYSDAIRLADAGKEKVEYNYARGVEAKEKINATKEAIEITRSQNSDVSNAESLLHQAEHAFSDGRYYEAIRLADQAYSITFDMDQDGLPNNEDFLPAIPNSYIYIGSGVGLIIIIIAAIYIVKKKK